MGAIEDTRRVLQDFLAPELRAVSARFDALEKRFNGVDRRLDGIDRKFEEVERRSERRHDEVMGALRQAIDLTFIQQRLAKLESQPLARQ